MFSRWTCPQVTGLVGTICHTLFILPLSGNWLIICVSSLALFKGENFFWHIFMTGSSFATWGMVLMELRLQPSLGKWDKGFYFLWLHFIEMAPRFLRLYWVIHIHGWYTRQKVYWVFKDIYEHLKERRKSSKLKVSKVNPLRKRISNIET